MRLISEAKCWSPNGGRKKISVDVVRNLQAVVTDLQQTLPKEKKLVLREDREEAVSCNYHGALFSTVPFSQRTVEFANSYAIDLVPLDTGFLGDEPKRMLDDMRSTLIRCIHHGSPAFASRGGYSDDVLRRLRSAGNHGDLSADGPERSALLDLVEFVLVNCSGRPPCCAVPDSILGLRNLIFHNRLASVDGHVVALNIPGEDFQALRRATARRFYVRASHGPDEGGVSDPFYPPPDDSPPEEDTPGGDTPYAPVYLEALATEPSVEESPRGQNMETRDDGRGDFVRTMFFMTGEAPDHTPTKIQVEATISRDLHSQLAVAERPRKVVIPVDFGCFFYGLLG